MITSLMKTQPLTASPLGVIAMLNPFHAAVPVLLTTQCMEVLSLFPLIRGETTQKGGVTTPEPHRKARTGALACLIACLSPET